MIGIDAVPKEVVIYLFKFLTPDSLCSVSAASKKFYELARQALPESINHHPTTSLDKYGFSNTNSVVEYAKIHGKALKVLNLCGFKITPNHLNRLTKLCPNLEYMNLGGAKSITDISSLKTLEKLVSLHLWCTGVKDVGPLTSLPNLKQLNLWGNRLNKDQLPQFDSGCEVTVRTRKIPTSSNE